jgi:hypothetical protein
VIVPARIPTKGGQACPPLAENLYLKFIVANIGASLEDFAVDVRAILDTKLKNL